MTADQRRKSEYGDFQTPQELSDEVLLFLKSQKILPRFIIEPTCGIGNFVRSSLSTFKSAKNVFCFELNEEYIAHLKASLTEQEYPHLTIQQENFFEKDWFSFFSELSGRLLIVGNPPWVTNSKIGLLKGNNLPQKNNFQKHKGFAAKTGKANFDISEWILIRLIESLRESKACIAMLCKVATARKVLRHAWTNDVSISSATIHLFDAKSYFNVAVSACLLVIHLGKEGGKKKAQIFSDFSFKNKIACIGIENNELVADAEIYEKLKDLDGYEHYKWRSGVKHDMSKVMELQKEGKLFVNGYGEKCDLESTYIYPLLKSSDLANGRLKPSKFIILTQKTPSEDTRSIKTKAPKTWKYLLDHSRALNSRKSIIYAKRPQFSIFGVGDYTYRPWKVAVSGLYKRIRFNVIGQQNGKPIVVDDTCYFLSFESKAQAQLIADLLNSKVCMKFIHSLVFLDAKRPVNMDMLSRIDLKNVAKRVDKRLELPISLNVLKEVGKKRIPNQLELIV